MHHVNNRDGFIVKFQSPGDAARLAAAVENQRVEGGTIANTAGEASQIGSLAMATQV